MKKINPLSGTFGFSRHKNPRFEKPKEPSIFHAPKPAHHRKENKRENIDYSKKDDIFAQNAD